MAENGWNFIDGKWYFASSSGKISQNKWEKIAGSWYYSDKDGIMLSNTTFDNYLLTKSGAILQMVGQKSTKIGTMPHPLWKNLSG